MEFDQSGDRVPDEKPILDAKGLKRLKEADLPLRGKYREELLESVIAQIESRRTVPGVSNRISNLAVTPVTNAMRERVESRTQQVVQKRVERAMGDRVEGEVDEV